jgi:hypothetical protein
MKSFGDWFRDQSRASEPVVIEQAEGDLPEGLYMKNGKPFATCRSCDRGYEWPVEVEKFEDNEYNLCGGSDRCIP